MKKVYIILTSFLMILSISLFYAGMRKPIKIALIGNFEEERSGFEASSIIPARIAEKDINSKLGILGRSTELVIINSDFKNPEEIIESLRKENIEAVITTASSSDLSILKPYLDKNRIVAISATATSHFLSSSKDYLYKMPPDDSREVSALLRYLDKSKVGKKFAVISQENNKEYANSVEDIILSKGGQVSYKDNIVGDSMVYVPKNLKGIQECDVLLILAAPKNTAFLLQNLRKNNVTTPIVGLSWCGDYNLLYYGGKALENFVFVTPIDFTLKTGKYDMLTKKLEGTYNKKNGLIPVGVYEAYTILSQAYSEKFKSHLTLKEALDKNNIYTGINDEKKFDEYGDSLGAEYIFTIKDGDFVKLEEYR